MNWSEYKSEFAWDGSWRDIYVLNTKIEDWQRFINLLRTSKYCDTSNSTTGAFSEDLLRVFTDHDNRPLLTINVGGVTLNCHFFTTDEIELDLDPRGPSGDVVILSILAT